MKFYLAGLFAVVALAGCGGDTGSDPAAAASNEALMSADELGDDWPLTVDEGIVRCEGAGEVYFEAAGKTYAVNGMAIGMSDLPEIDPIWADDPEREGLKISVHPIIDRGLSLCD